MAGKAVISLTTGLEDSEKVTVALLVAVGAAESGRPTVMFLTKEAVRLALNGTAVEVGFGTGLNAPYYPAEVTNIVAIEPSQVCMRLAAPASPDPIPPSSSAA